MASINETVEYKAYIQTPSSSPRPDQERAYIRGKHVPSSSPRLDKERAYIRGKHVPSSSPRLDQERAYVGRRGKAYIRPPPPGPDRGMAFTGPVGQDPKVKLLHRHP
jgi:hypothetical protein